MREGRGDNEEEDQTEGQTENVGYLLRGDLRWRGGAPASFVQDGVAERPLPPDFRQGKQ